MEAQSRVIFFQAPPLKKTKLGYDNYNIKTISSKIQWDGMDGMDGMGLLRAPMVLVNIAKGTTDPGVDYFDQ